MINYLVRWLVWLVLRVVLLLPFSLTYRIACGVGDLIFWILPSRRKIVFENLERAYGGSLTTAQKTDIARQSFRSMVLSSVELFSIPKMMKEAPQRFRLLNREHLDCAFRQGKGVILVISHLGSWEYLGFLPFLTKQPWSVVVRDIRNPYLNRDVNDLRRMTGLNPIPKDSAVKPIMKELKQNHGVAILIDQWASDEGVWQDFFGQGTSTTSIPARLALRYGSALVPAYCLRKSPGCYEIEIQEPLTVTTENEAELTGKMNRMLEVQIKKHPGQWLWMHRRWKSRPATTRHKP